MNTSEDTHGLRKISGMSLGISIILMLLHGYYYCHAAFQEWKLTTKLSDNILDNITKTGLFGHPSTSKLLILAFLTLSLPGAQGRKQESVRYRHGLLLTGTGLIIYFGTYFILPGGNPNAILTCTYFGCTTIGYFLIARGGVRLTQVMTRAFRKEGQADNKSGFLQENRLLETEYSLHLPAHYTWQGKVHKMMINFINPRRGILIMGSPGSGKSWFIIEPMLRQLIEGGFSLFVYDFKYDVLTSLVYNEFLRNQESYPSGTKFYAINFTDLARSNRCNLLDPATLEYIADAIGASRTILLSMNKTWVNRQGEFFVESPINFLAALIWYLRSTRGGMYCTLPHVIELAQTPYDKLFTLLNTHPDIQTLINPFVQAFRNKTMEMLDGQITSAKIPLGRLASPEIYYVLTGNDLSLNINDPSAPKIFCLGGDPPRHEALAPVLSLYIDRVNKLTNRPGRYRCALICDEFATVRAASMLTTIATARSNDIIPILAVQDLSQLRTQYSRDEADLILNITGNLVCGQVGGETARWVSERFPAVTQYRSSISVNSSDTSIGKSEQSGNAMSPATIATLSSGEFVGIVTDDPGTPLELKAFHATIEKEADRHSKAGNGSGGGKGRRPLPFISKVEAGIIRESFLRVKEDITGLVTSEMARILQDPELMKMVVK